VRPDPSTELVLRNRFGFLVSFEVLLVGFSVIFSVSIKVVDLAQKMTIKAGEILKVLMGMGVMVTLNDVIDQDTALLVVEEMGHIGVASKEETIEDVVITFSIGF
jgi:hypothetical protein